MATTTNGRECCRASRLRRFFSLAIAHENTRGRGFPREVKSREEPQDRAGRSMRYRVKSRDKSRERELLAVLSTGRLLRQGSSSIARRLARPGTPDTTNHAGRAPLLRGKESLTRCSPVPAYRAATADAIIAVQSKFRRERVLDVNRAALFLFRINVPSPAVYAPIAS